MTRTAAETRGGTFVLVAGGGVAALETALALRTLAPGLVDVELIAPELHFYYRPLAVAEPFGIGRVRRWELGDLVHSAGANFAPGELAGIDAEAQQAELKSGLRIDYDSLVLACGARPEAAVPGALTFRGPADVEALRRVLDEIARGEAGRLVFAVPSGVVWPLPLYELALLTATELEARGVQASLTIVTSEPAPLAIFGGAAATAVETALLERGIAVRTSAYPVEASGAGLTCVGADPIAADRVVALPRLRGPEIGGIPQDANGFVRADEHGRVLGLDNVFAAGDLTTFPIKQGGLAAQQADAVAETIALAAGAPVDPRPFMPVLRALLLTGRGSTFLQVELGGGHGETSTASEEPMWSPAGKIVGRHIAPFLAELGALEVSPAPGESAIRIELDPAEALGSPGWTSSCVSGFERTAATSPGARPAIPTRSSSRR
jgi:sulfide:quinone oxidoreductase